ncbi:hypothetical protein QQF64_021832 [Cirrhinus molitorella]|uniref:Ig-like domain-containing protein n=1 Tax=Cirrhinus molitorella TaxID=172907 RepID=A0ABR3L9Z1_9TELE
MLSTSISCFLLLIHIISIVNGGITKALEGENITLSCTATRRDIEDKTNINALWKKETGQKVIWEYSGEKKIAETFLNRQIDIDCNFSLIINECNQTDQGVYILYINRKQSCKVKLLVTGKQCSHGKSPSDAPSDATQDLKVSDENNLNENPAKEEQRKVYLTIAGVLLFLGIIFCLVVLHIARKNTTKTDKSEHEVLNPPCTVIQAS